MTEQERQALLSMALTYWLPIGWDDGGSRYERIGYEFFGDVTSGGIRVTASKDGATAITIDFSNEDCYGDSKLGAEDAMNKFLASFGS
jgi:hypothetical protein